jgi:ATP-binding cassette subfamily G (WHITE) protein 2
LNGKDYSRSEIKWIGGYVMQDDILNPHLTVYETINYAAKLRLPTGTKDSV